MGKFRRIKAHTIPSDFSVQIQQSTFEDQIFFQNIIPLEYIQFINSTVQGCQCSRIEMNLNKCTYNNKNMSLQVSKLHLNFRKNGEDIGTKHFDVLDHLSS